MTRVIGIVSGKGGVGKTTLALNLGAILAQNYKKNVTVIDCNVTTSHLGLYLGMYYCPSTLNKVLRKEKTIEEAINDHFSGMKVVPASLSLSDLEGVDLTLLKDNVSIIKDRNDLIFLDSSPGLGREALATLKACDEVIFVTTPYVPSVMDIIRCQEVVNEIGVKTLGIVLNMTKNKKYEMAKSEIEQLTRLPIIASIPYDENINKSVSSKMPVVIFNPNAKSSKEMYRFAASLIGETYQKEGLLSKFLNGFRLRFKRKEPEFPLP